jgi:hypothetical protein
MKPDIDHTALTTLLHYNPDTGEFTQKLKWWNREPGDKPGGVSPQGYWYLCVGGKQYPAHRLAWFYMYGQWPKGDIDHINRNRLDNRIANLRDTTTSRNLHNSPNRGCISGVKGVHINKEKKWDAVIMVDGVNYRLNSYKTIEEAAQARKFLESLLLAS